MGAGKNAALSVLGIAEGIECVFDDIVPGRADDMEEELAGEFRQGETGADLAAVEHDTGGTAQFAEGDCLLPFRQHLAAGIEEDERESDLARPIAGPIIRCRKARVQSIRIAEEGEIGSEIERVEIVAAIGEQPIRQAQRVEADDLGAGGHEVADMVGEAPGIEGGDQHAIGLCRGEFGHRLCRAAEQLAPHRVDVLDKDAGAGVLGDPVELGKAGGKTERIVDRKGARAGQSGDQTAGETCRHRMCRRLEKAVAALAVVEGFDIELMHRLPPRLECTRYYIDPAEYISLRRDGVAEAFAARLPTTRNGQEPAKPETDARRSNAVISPEPSFRPRRHRGI